MAPDADRPTSRTLLGNLCLDAVACEASRLIRPKGDAVDGGCILQNSRTRVCMCASKFLGLLLSWVVGCLCSL